MEITMTELTVHAYEAMRWVPRATQILNAEKMDAVAREVLALDADPTRESKPVARVEIWNTGARVLRFL